MEKVVLIGAITAKTTESEVNEYLRELEFLAFTAGGDVKKSRGNCKGEGGGGRREKTTTN